MFAWTSHGTELKRFFRQPITRGALAVLLLIPLLYGAMYVWAFWSPTERLSDLPVALVNEDAAVTSNGQTVNAGADVVGKLVAQKPLGWRQVDAQTASDGVKSGKYYFSVTIPATFSSDIASLGGSDPRAAEIQVKYNDSNSFLATELGSNAMVQIRDAVSQEIGQQAAKTLVVGLSSARSGLSDASDGAFVLQDGLKTAKDGSQQLSVGANQLAQGAAALASGAGALADGTASASTQVSGLPSGVSTLNSGAQQLANGLGDLQTQTPTLVSGVQSVASGSSQLADAQSRYVTGIEKAASGAAQVANGTQELDSQFSTLSSGVSSYAAGATAYTSGASDIATGADKYSEAATQWQSGASTWLNLAHSGASELSAGASQLAQETGKDSKLYEGASEVAQGTSSLSGQLKTMNKALQQAQTLLSDGQTTQAEEILTNLESQTGTEAQNQTQTLAAGAAAVQNGIYSTDASTEATSVNGAATALQSGADELSNATGSGSKLATGLTSLSSAEETLATGSKNLTTASQSLSTGSAQLSAAADKLSSRKSQIDTLNSGAQQLNAAFTAADPNNGLVSGAKAIQSGAQSLSDGTQKLSSGTSTLSSGVDQLAEGGKQVASGTSELNSKVPSLVSGVQQINSATQQISTATQTLKSGAATLAGKAPSLTKGIDQAQSGSGTLGQKLKQGASQIPNDNATTQQTRSTAISSPVNLASSYLHKVASWGEFFSPFFIGLGLWVGALITWLLLRPLQSRALMTSVSGFRMAWGSLNSALTLALGQVIIMLSVMHFAIGLDPHDAIATFLFTLLVAAAFFALQQMLQIAFGSAVGKVIIISVLMLQLASAGGTYPIQTEPRFFQAVSRWMPMTYVVNGLREAITGGIGPRFWIAVAVMVGIFAVSLTLSSILASRKRMWSLSRLHPALSI